MIGWFNLLINRTCCCIETLAAVLLAVTPCIAVYQLNSLLYGLGDAHRRRLMISHQMLLPAGCQPRKFLSYPSHDHPITAITIQTQVKSLEHMSTFFMVVISPERLMAKSEAAAVLLAIVQHGMRPSAVITGVPMSCPSTPSANILRRSQRLQESFFVSFCQTLY